MIKINGQRVELEEIEYNLKEIKEIKDCAVKYFSNDTKNYLVAYYLSEEKLDNNYIRMQLSNKLANYMIPNMFVRLDKLPILSNGKLNRNDLPKPNITKSQAKYKPPTIETERAICDVFSQVFNIDKIGTEDDFITLGGDSLLAIKMLSALKDYNITATDITNLKTPKEIARKIQKYQTLNLNLDKYTLESGSPLSEPQLNIYLDIIMNKKIESYLIPLSIKLDKHFTKKLLVLLTT